MDVNITQISPDYRKLLEKQQYRVVGNHSAVKICTWARNMIKSCRGCYKYEFYGIRSHQCLQMTTSMFCANRCTFCWRDEKAPVAKEWYGPVDEPEFIVDESIKQQIKLLQGFKGNDAVNKQKVSEMNNVRHAALSLIGEPIMYPKINELLDEFHKRKISTFLVTNAQYPEAIEKIKNVTQLYVSVDAPNKELLKKIDRPLFPDYYERLLKSLEILSKKKFRTCVRLTAIHGINDSDLEGYKKLISLGNPDFVEVKGYMRLGASRNHHAFEHMPEHEIVVKFAKQLEQIMPDYEIVAEHKTSRAVCLMKKSMNGKRFIDFKKFFEFVNNSKNKSKEISAEEYSAKEMQDNY